MPDDLYERDILAWSIMQSDRLARLRRGERPNDVDWDNLIDEVESVGRSELHATTSHLERGLEHLLTLAAWPDADPDRHWVKEARAFLRGFRKRFTPSMRQSIDLPSIYAEIRADVLTERIAGRSPRALRVDCPFTLDELLDERLDMSNATARLVEQSAPFPLAQ